MGELSFIAYACASVVSFILLVLLLTIWRARLYSTWMALPVLASCIWAGLLASSVVFGSPSIVITLAFEIIRDLAWLFVLSLILRSALSESAALPSIVVQFVRAGFLVGVGLLVILLFADVSPSDIPAWVGFDVRLIGHMSLAVVGLILVEQILRNARKDERWGLKFVCIGIGGILVMDFVLYSDALLFQTIDADLWVSRGLINALLLPLLAVAIYRNPLKSSHILFSRTVVFYSAAIFLAGGYMMIMSFGGFFLKQFGGDWGAVLRATFIFTALIGLVILLYSGQMRARLRVFVDKHLLNYKYDYREEWLRLIRELSGEDSALSLEKRVLQVLSDIVDASCASLWLRVNGNQFSAVEELNMKTVIDLSEPDSASLIKFLEQTQWVINIEEYEADRSRYSELTLPSWVQTIDRGWLIVPLMLNNRLYGFVVLAKPRAERELNWEDIDLLKTAGRQIATYLAHARSALALVQARQFEAFNRLSAYVIHDLKNLVSQLALIVKNAEKHRHNPDFMDDAITTVDNAVARMNRLLAQLRSDAVDHSGKSLFNVVDILHNLVTEKSNSRPAPQLQCDFDQLLVEAVPARFHAVLGHIIQNAQDATDDSGSITISVDRFQGQIVIKITDSGQGMSKSFIKERLFKPFDTTKGLTGMGIGAHEVKAYVEEMGGSVKVESNPGKGTTFTVFIPDRS